MMWLKMSGLKLDKLKESSWKCLPLSPHNSFLPSPLHTYMHVGKDVLVAALTTVFALCAAISKGLGLWECFPWGKDGMDHC